MEDISWTYRVRNECMLPGVNERRNIMYTMKRRKTNWIRHMLSRNFLLKRTIEEQIKGVIEVTGRRRNRYKQLLDNFEETKGYRKMKEEALACNVWRTHFGRGYGLVLRQIKQWINTTCEHHYTNYVRITVHCVTMNLLLKIHTICEYMWSVSVHAVGLSEVHYWVCGLCDLTSYEYSFITRILCLLHMMVSTTFRYPQKQLRLNYEKTVHLSAITDVWNHGNTTFVGIIFRVVCMKRNGRQHLLLRLWCKAFILAINKRVDQWGNLIQATLKEFRNFYTAYFITDSYVSGAGIMQSG